VEWVKVVGPEFKPWFHKKKKKQNNRRGCVGRGMWPKQCIHMYETVKMIRGERKK
jgi:hypothetical protein